MKRILAAAALVAICSSVSFAVGITGTKHDLSFGAAGGGPKATAQTQICIFCHTPHNAIQNIPLWNRTYSAPTFKLYTASGSLTQAKGTNSALYSDSISLFCLSCHDGTVAELGSRVNRQGTGTAMAGAAIWTGGTATTGPAMLGSDLTNDHPIGFVYPTAGEAGRLRTGSAALTAVNAAKGAAPASTAIFFTSNAGTKTNQMECASCHLVHDNANAPFLRATNAASALCLACHIK